MNVLTRKVFVYVLIFLTHARHAKSFSVPAKRNSQHGGSALDASITPNQLSTFTAAQIITHFKYPVETHQVKTNDGFTLGLQRIPTGKTSPTPGKRGAVLLWHGFAGSSNMWFANLEHNILAFQLADNGYDVWLGNTRGNSYSDKHDRWSNRENPYWNFSLHELGQYDAPASIDYILEKTGETQLFYIGHSTGATQFFIMNSLYPEYSKKVRLMIALAPAVYMSHSEGLFALIAVAEQFPIVSKVIGVVFHREVPHLLWSIFTLGFNTLCAIRAPWAEFSCRIMAELIVGPSDQSLITHFPALFSMFSRPVSYFAFTHFTQWRRVDRFNQYDFGAKENMAKYNSASPPLYYLSRTYCPVAIISAPTDILTMPKDVQRAVKELPYVVHNVQVNTTKFNHGDFLYARDLRFLVNQPILQLLAKYL